MLSNSLLWFSCLHSALPSIWILLLVMFFYACVVAVMLLYGLWLYFCWMMILTFHSYLSIISNSFPNRKYGLMFCFTSFLSDGHPLMMYSFNSCVLFQVASCMPCIDMHVGLSFFFFFFFFCSCNLKFILMPVISLSLFLVFPQHLVYHVYRSRPGL